MRFRFPVSLPRLPTRRPRGVAVGLTTGHPETAFVALQETPEGAVRPLAIYRHLADDGAVRADQELPLRYLGVQLVDEEAQAARQRLAGWVAQSRQRGAPATLTLLPGDYNLLQIERPPVKTEELAQAVRWQLRDLLDYPLEDAVVDAFEIPPPVQRGRPAMIYAVAAHRTLLRDRVSLAQGAGLKPWRIDIAELALRNLAERLAYPEETVATLLLLPDRGLVQISRGATLYLTRTLEDGMDRLAPDPVPPDAADRLALARERLALELQRTMDYCDTQFGIPPVKRLLLIPEQPRIRPLAESLGQNLGLTPDPLPLDQLLFPAPGDPAGWSAAALLALGGSLNPAGTD